MALSNWLTRAEWNGCWAAGLLKLSTEREQEPGWNLGDQLRAGIGLLHQAGYVFEGITSTAEGEYEKVKQCSEGNETVLLEQLDGTFDRHQRGLEALAFFKEKVPGYDCQWLAEALEPEHGE